MLYKNQTPVPRTNLYGMAPQAQKIAAVFAMIMFYCITGAYGNVDTASQPAVQDVGMSIVAAAREQIGVTVVYDPAYVRLAYPMGDVPIERGVCTDVVIRALRTALNIDLQRLVHEDMTVAFAEYPNSKKWGLKAPDRHIDHRRVLNLNVFFKRKGWEIATTNYRDPSNYLPGDIVSSLLPGSNLTHIVIVSDEKTADGVPLIIHNIGAGTKEADRLFDFNITGHYRVKP